MKFKNEEEIVLNTAVDLEQYLSSGTIKGIITFSMVKEVLQSDGITVENLSYILTRNDIKRSYAYQSGFLEGTTLTYEAYIRLKESLI